MFANDYTNEVMRRVCVPYGIEVMPSASVTPNNSYGSPLGGYLSLVDVACTIGARVYNKLLEDLRQILDG